MGLTKIGQIALKGVATQFKIEIGCHRSRAVAQRTHRQKEKKLPFVATFCIICASNVQKLFKEYDYDTNNNSTD